MQSIYLEAVLFVLVFGAMSVASIIISKRQADAYIPEVIEEENPLSKTEQRIEELLKLLNRGLLTHEEFQILKESKVRPSR